MTFPTEQRPMLVELRTVANDWTNITTDVFSKRQPIRFTSGVPGEYGLSQPSTASFQINNRQGRYAPRNPTSPLYKQIGRNTPVRVSIGEGAFGMVTSGIADSAGRAFTNDSAALSITGDMDLRFDMELLQDPLSEVNSSWSSGSFDVASKFDDFDTARSWTLIVIGGKPRLTWFTAGTVASAKVATASTQLGPSSAGRKVLRVVLDVNNGAAGNDVLFYTGTDINGAVWTQLGTTVTQAGVTSVFDGIASVRVGANPTASIYTYTEPASATYYSAQIRNGINGTLVANPIFSAQPLDPEPFTSSAFTDAQGNVWGYAGNADAARIWYGNVDVRFCGECSSFPNRWDESENDRWVPIEAAGLLRRLGTGSDPAPSGLRDWILAQTNQPTSYFPLAGGETTTYSINLGRVGNRSARYYAINGGSFTYGKDFSAPWLDTGMEYAGSGHAGRMIGDIVCGDDNLAFDFVFQSPHLGQLEYTLYDLSGNSWRFQFNDATDTGGLVVTWTSFSGTVTNFPLATEQLEFSDANVHTARFQVLSGVTGIQDFSLYIDGTLRHSGTNAAAGNPWGGTWYHSMLYGRTNAQDVINLAHLTLWSFPSSLDIPVVTAYDFAARGFAGETAAFRMQRVATTGAIPFTYEGSGGESMVMGPLYSESKLSQLRDAEAADMGMLLERRDALGLKYRTRGSLINQPAALTLDYSLGQIVAPFEPTDDDAFTKNDMTVTRRNGDSARATVTTGRLSVSEPPVGVGRYHDEVSMNVQTDALLPGIAAWLAALGTVDQPRYPNVTVDLGILAGVGLDLTARRVEAGDLLVIKNLSRVGIYDDVRLLVLGIADETISEGGFQHRITWNCAPYQGYEGFAWADGVSMLSTDARWDTPGATLVSAVSTTATTLSVASSATPWTTDATAFPFDIQIEGERITVTNITGASSPQSFTVTRSVNGVVKAQSAAADVRLANPSYWSL